MNEEYSAKCKRLEKLVEVKSELYGSLSAHLNSSVSGNENSNCSDFNAIGLLEDIDE